MPPPPLHSSSRTQPCGPEARIRLREAGLSLPITIKTSRMMTTRPRGPLGAFPTAAVRPSRQGAMRSTPGPPQSSQHGTLHSACEEPPPPACCSCQERLRGTGLSLSPRRSLQMDQHEQTTPTERRDLRPGGVSEAARVPPTPATSTPKARRRDGLAIRRRPVRVPPARRLLPSATVLRPRLAGCSTAAPSHDPGKATGARRWRARPRRRERAGVRLFAPPL